MLDPRTGNVEVWITDLGARQQQSCHQRRSECSMQLQSGRRMAPGLCFGPIGAWSSFYQRSAAGGGSEQVLLSYKVIRAAGIHVEQWLINTDWSPERTEHPILGSKPKLRNGSLAAAAHWR